MEAARAVVSIPVIGEQVESTSAGEDRELVECNDANRWGHVRSAILRGLPLIVLERKRVPWVVATMRPDVLNVMV